MQIEFLEFKVIIYYDKDFNVYIIITGIVMFYASKIVFNYFIFLLLHFTIF